MTPAGRTGSPLRVKWDVADFVDHQQRIATKPEQFGLQSATGVGVGELVDPLAAGAANRQQV